MSLWNILEPIRIPEVKLPEFDSSLIKAWFAYKSIVASKIAITNLQISGGVQLILDAFLKGLQRQASQSCFQMVS